MVGTVDTQDLVWGWVSGSNNRGSLDILYSSLATIYLCTWTSLCLNIARPYRHRWRFLVYKIRWQMFAILFPEVLVAVAAEQWLCALQSVREFEAMGHPGWTIRHGFFVDMGGLMIKPPDFESFSINSQQLAYLVKNGDIPMPDIDSEDIQDVNKLDELARAIALVQAGYFCAQSIARGVQRIGLAPLELTTLAFILCTLHTALFWYHKPLDPIKARVLDIDTPIAHILNREQRTSEYTRTPLEFIIPPPDSKSLVAPFWFGLDCSLGVFDRQHEKPIKTLANSKVSPPRGIGWLLTVYLLLFQLMYFGLLLGAGWNMSFPSDTESIIWAASNFAEIGLITLYVLALPFGTLLCDWGARKVFKRNASSLLELASMLPPWAKLLIHGPFVYVYILARVAVLVESLICLRALPPALYIGVNWSNFIPHI